MTQTAKVLNNIGGIAASLPGALAGDTASRIALITNAAGLAGSLFDFGDTAMQAERRRLAEENTAAMIKLANSLSTLNSQLDDERGIFGSKGPADDLQKLIAKLAAKNPFFAGLTGKDLTNPADREMIRQLIEKVFESISQFGDDNYAQLTSGDMTGRDFVDALKQIIALLNETDGQSGPTGTGGYNVSHEITEVSAGRLVGLMTSSARVPAAHGRRYRGDACGAPRWRADRSAGALRRSVLAP
jgi:hypothetical protein